MARRLTGRCGGVVRGGIGRGGIGRVGFGREAVAADKAKA